MSHLEDDDSDGSDAFSLISDDGDALPDLTQATEERRDDLLDIHPSQQDTNLPDTIPSEIEGDVTTLTKTIKGEPHNYDARVALITLLRANLPKDSSLLQEARLDLSTTFPLSESLWVDWLDDIVDAPLPHQLEIAFRATQDYLSIPLWQRYLHLSLAAHSAGHIEFDILRQHFQKALFACNYHIAESHTIWSTLIQFEQSLIQDNEENRDSQITRVQNLYLERLRIPHAALEDTFSMYSSFVSAHFPAEYESIMIAGNAIFSATNAIYQYLDPYEQALRTSSASLDAWTAYLTFARFTRHPNHLALPPPLLRTLYERAIQAHCLSAPLWLDYLLYLQTHYKVRTWAISTADRAVRNCPWSGDIWAESITLEADPVDWGLILPEALQRSLAHPILQAYPIEQAKPILAYFKAILREAKAHPDASDPAHVKTTMKDLLQTITADPASTTQTYALLAQTMFMLSGMDVGRSIWEDQAKALGHTLAYWVAYIAFETDHGNTEQAYSLMKRAHFQVTDFPAEMGAIYLDAMEKRGSPLDKIIQCRDRTASTVHHAGERRRELEAMTQIQIEEMESAAAAKKEKRIAKDKAFKAKKKEESKRKKQVERERKQAMNPDQGAEAPSSLAHKAHLTSKDKRDFSIMVNNLTADTDRALLEGHFSTFGEIRESHIFPEKGYGYITFLNTVSRDAALASPNPLVNGQTLHVHTASLERDPSTVYVTRFPPATTEEELHSLFSKYGRVKNVRMPVAYDKTGKRRVFAYIEFESETSANDSLVLDGQSILGDDLKYAMSVAISDPLNRKTREVKPVAKPEINPRLLFIGGGGHDLSLESLEETFSPLGTILHVKVLKDGKGTPTGAAFLEYADEASAQWALSLDNTVVNGRTINVQIADPNKKRKSPAEHHTHEGKKGKETRPTNARSSQRLQQHLGGKAQRPSAKLAVATPKVEEASAPKTSVAPSASGKPLSNDDFRAMLFSKK